MATAGPSDPQRDALPRGAALGLLLLYVILYLLPLGVRPLTSPDEVRYSAIAHEMLASGDWVSPHFNGVRYFEKPPLGYWLNAASLAALGENTFAMRLPVALATGLTALILFLLVRRFISAVTAAFTTLIFLTTLLVAGVGTVAVLDAFLALFLTAALAAYYVALEEHRNRRYAYLAICGAACAAAFLVKGLLGLAIPVIVAAPYLGVRGRWRPLLTTPWVPIAVAALLILPWSVMIHLREPDFWRYFIFVEHFNRFAGGTPQHEQPFWVYAAYLPLTGWPWTLLLPAALIGLRLGEQQKRFLWYACAWAVLPLLFLSLSKGKLQTYILPCFAPLSILLAAGLERYLVTGARRAVRGGAVLIGVVFAGMLGIVVAAQTGSFGEPPYAAGEMPKLLALLAALTAGVACAVGAYRSRLVAAGFISMAGAGAAVLLPAQLALPARALEQIAPGATIAQYVAAAPDTILVADARLFGATAWTLKRNDVYVVNSGEIAYGLSYPEDRHRVLEGDGLRQLIESNRGRHEILIICWPSNEPEVTGQLPPTAERSQHGNVVFWRVPSARPSP